MVQGGKRELPALCCTSDLAKSSLARGRDSAVQLGADGIHVLLAGLALTVDVARVARVGALALMRIGQLLLRRLQVRPEAVDVVQPGRGPNGLGVALDQRDGIGLIVELLHQAQHRRDVRRMRGGRHDVLELGVELGRVHDEVDRLAPLHQDDQERDERHQDEGEQDDDEQRGQGGPFGDVHRSLSEVRSVPQSLKREVVL